MIAKSLVNISGRLIGIDIDECGDISIINIDCAEFVTIPEGEVVNVFCCLTNGLALQYNDKYLFVEPWVSDYILMRV